MREIVIGSRGSTLALAQADIVARALLALDPGLLLRREIIVTNGDRSQASDAPMNAGGEKGVFAREIEAALLDGSIDLAVHSMKDLPSILPSGLVIGAVPRRDDPRDVLLGKPLDELPSRSKVGTSSSRRAVLLKEMRPDLDCVPIRGNVDTRIAKLKNGEYDAIALAAAGLSRLGRTGEIAQYFDPAFFIPDPGQGMLAVEIRGADNDLAALVKRIGDPETEVASQVERGFQAELGTGCSAPVGAWACVIPDENKIIFRAFLAHDNGEIIRYYSEFDKFSPEKFGRQAALEIKSRL